MTALDALVTPLIKEGQSLTHICAEHGEELPVSQRTLYNYIDSGTLSVGNLDLRRKVGYRPRNDFSIVEFPTAVNAYPFFSSREGLF